MGCCASTGGNYRKSWYEIRPKVPVGDSQSGTRAELFTKLDSDKSGSVGVSAMEDVSSIFHLESVADQPVALLTEVYTATVGSAKLTSAGMSPFVERLRDAFDLFTMVNPEHNEAKKNVTNDDVRALEAQFGIMNYEWPSTARESWAKEVPQGKTEVPFTQFLKWALRERLSLMKLAGPVRCPQYPVQPAGAETKIRDIIYAQFDVDQGNRLSLQNVNEQCVRYLAVDQYGGWDPIVRSSFNKVAKSDSGSDAKYIDRQEFRKFLSSLNDGITASMIPQQTTSTILPIDWKGLSAHFPYQRSAEQLKIRDGMYATFDDNHTGKMSLSEASAGCSKTYKDIPTVVTDAAVKRAFFTAAGADDTGGDSQFVERNEFRVFIGNLHDYCQLRAFNDSIGATGDLKKRNIAAMDPFWTHNNDDAAACSREVTGLAAGNEIPFETLATWWIRRRRAKDMARRS